MSLSSPDFIAQARRHLAEDQFALVLEHTVATLANDPQAHDTPNFILSCECGICSHRGEPCDATHDEPTNTSAISALLFCNIKRHCHRIPLQDSSAPCKVAGAY